MLKKMKLFKNTNTHPEPFELLLRYFFFSFIRGICLKKETQKTTIQFFFYYFNKMLYVFFYYFIVLSVSYVFGAPRAASR